MYHLLCQWTPSTLSVDTIYSVRGHHLLFKWTSSTLSVDKAILLHCCRECFDAVYGSSAGAINATYFLSGQREGVRIYHEDIANKQFVDLSRLLDRKNEQGPVLNLSFLMDHVMELVKPLYWDAVLDSPIPLKVHDVHQTCFLSLGPCKVSIDHWSGCGIQQENSSDAKLQTMRHYNFFLMHVHATLPERIGHV